LKNKNILLVEDSIFAAKLVSDFLLENRYNTEIVSTGEAAVTKACHSSQIDLIIMDIELAGSINGIDAASKILDCITIPIIFLTANSSKEIMQKVKALHAYGFVLKGGDNYALLSTIEMAFNLFEAIVKTKELNTRLTKSYEELEGSRKQYLELAEHAPVGIVKCDNKGNIVFVNQSALEVLGSPSAKETTEINLLTFPSLINCGFSEHLKNCLRDNENGIYEMNYKSKWGKTVYIRLHIKTLSDGNKVNSAQLIIDDITEKKHLEEELRRLSLTDPLTNVYNRRLFIQTLEREIARVERQNNGRFCIAMLDIDHFKNVNDRFGHASGDIVLKGLTETIKKRLRGTDCLARWGGEEFMILFPCTQINEALLLVEELRKRISRMELPFENNITVSFGVVEYRSGDTTDSIIQGADNLLYAAKKAGRNCVRS